MVRRVKDGAHITTEVVELELELWDKSKGIDLRDHWAYRQLSPALRWGIAEMAKPRDWSPIVTYCNYEVACYAGERTVYNPPDHAYPGSPPHAEVRVADREDFLTCMKDSLDQMEERLWMLMSWYDRYYLWELFDTMMDKFADWLSDNYQEFVSYFGDY